MPRMTRLDDITVCPMTEADLDEVLAIESVSYPKPWAREHFLDELGSPYAFPLVALNGDGRVAGYICPVLLLDEGEIRNVAVDPGMRGSGVGRLLVEAVLEECRSRGAAYVGLEVRVSNQAARALYRKLGFVETGVRPKYYENGEDAVLMECPLDRSGES
ncbi:putative ribosomal-protein-alanine acetyltransferase [Geobacter sp. OR-1]|uniref:ribosomal protein S18-alanine N-acetyltransferase n=1 Tax=Geobacter sp. OR-1 TaxID=1266765 RepID=UPI0005420087|nr:ribosomal protein S18-alanine N-acetyltransferase [Geobacter sp. OR-1]GAM11550.1 putative ribosomal-protein-alanine acetyltransferase [Geobacter sp. OR-1]